MAVNYFNKFPKIAFDVNNDGSFSNLVDITKTVDINTIDEDSVTYYTYHEIQDGERPDNLSYKLYNTPQYYWTFFVVNDSLKAGLNNAWPLNSHAFEQMIVNEYDPYTAITFDPLLHDSLDSDGILPPATAEKMESDFSVVPLVPIDNLITSVDDQDEYLPYLRLTHAEGINQPTAKILKYDSTTCQLVIYDIQDSAGNPGSRSSFIAQTLFKLIWVNPYPYDETAETQSPEYESNEALKKRYVEKALAFYEPIDQYYYPGRVADNEEGTFPRYDIGQEEQYVFDKIYKKVAGVYSWELYRNATAQYTLTQNLTIDGESVTTTIPISIYDILKSSLNGTVGKISFYEKEETSNTEKRNIKIIRPETIREFSKTYFELLNR